MKKFFTLVAMAFVAIGANAQAVIAEIDWTQQEAYYNDVWYPSDMANVSVSSEGLVIDCLQTSPETANYWEPQVPMIAHIEALEEGGQYQVKFDVNAPAAGEIRLDFCSWTEGAKTTQDWIGSVVEGYNEFTVDFLDYPGETTNAMIFYQCGKIPGKHVIKKVQVIDLEAEGGGGEGEPALLSEIDWTQESAYYSDVWYANDLATVTVTQGEGLIIDCSSDGTTNYWEPQVPMIAHIPALEEGGQYQVKFDVTAPAAGDIRLDFCSWTEGAKTTQDWIGSVVEGYNEFTVDFLDYPGETTNAMIFYQCGKIPGRHIIKKVQVFDLDATTGIQEMKVAKTVNTGLYNLSGQRVGLNYKGVVIQNGKKYLQK